MATIPHTPAGVNTWTPSTRDELPAELTSTARWIIWRNEEGRKVPYQANAPHAKASTTTPAHWTHFTGAFAAARRHNAGVGFVFTADAGYVGIDLDDCLNERGDLAPWAAHILRLAGETYAEVSPSGRGIKLWVRGALPEGKGVKTPVGDGAVEAYDRARYFTVTGRRWNNAPLTIGDGTRVVEHILVLARSAAPAKANGHTNGAGFPPAIATMSKGADVVLAVAHQVRTAREGDRNNTLNKAGYTFGGLIAAGAIRNEDQDAFYTMLYDAGLRCGLPEEEVRSTLEHSIQRGAERPFLPDDWSAPAPLPESDTPALPEFPLHILPATYRRYVEEIAAMMQVDPAMPAMAGLAVVAGALCGTMRIAARKGAQIEQPGLYAAIVAPTGDRKSAVLKHILEPVVAHERREREAARERERALKALRSDLADAKRVRDEAKVADLQSRIADVEYQQNAASRELLVTDATSQALGAMLNKTGGRAFVASAEGDMIEHIGGRYNDGNPDLNIYLSGYSADPLRILRKERNEFIEAPSLAVLQMMQPARLREFLRIPTVIQRGLAARMLITLPRTNIGERSYYPPGVARTAKAAIEAKVDALLAREVLAFDNQRTVIEFTQAGEDVLEQWHNETEALLARNDIDETLRNWLARAVGHAIRLANAIHALRDSGPGFVDQIDAEDAQAGVTLARYCYEHLKAALCITSTAREIELARVVIDWLIQEGKAEVTRREVQRRLHHRSSITTAQDVVPILDVLEAYGYIRKADDVARRRSERWLVNPLIFAEQEV